MQTGSGSRSSSRSWVGTNDLTCVSLLDAIWVHLIELGMDTVPAIHVSAPQLGLKSHDVLEQVLGAIKVHMFPKRIQLILKNWENWNH